MMHVCCYLLFYILQENQRANMMSQAKKAMGHIQDLERYSICMVIYSFSVSYICV